MKRVAAASALILLAAAVGTAGHWAPPLLQRAETFTVERVEVSGTRLLAPQEVLSLLDLPERASVWHDPGAHEAVLTLHPVISEARVTRRLPGTLRVRIREKAPVALLDGRSLRLVTADGEVLPVSPARAPLDLPIVRGANGAGQPDSLTTALVAELGRLAELDPAVASRISELRRGPAGELVALLADPALEVVLPAGADLARLLQLRAVLGELARQAEESTRRVPLRVDLRFQDQVVVRFSSPA
jgi:cell division protein FtsQ